MIGPVATPGAAATPPPVSERAPVVDETAESTPDTLALYEGELSRKVALAMVAQQNAQQEAQLRLDRLKADFNRSQEERTEMLREMNALRDMAIEQSKQDDEVLKKYIAMI